METCEELERFEPGQVEVEAQFAGQVADSRPGVEALCPTVVAENKRLAAGGAEQIEQEADGRGLPCAIQPEEAERLASVDVEVEILQGGEWPVSLGEAANRNHGLRRAVRAHLRILA